MPQPSISTIKTLFALSCNHCAFPGCEEALTDPKWKEVKAEMAHICGDKLGSARHDATMSDDERQGFDNLILLCPNHHRLIDRLSPDEYTVEGLREMKARHEQSCAGVVWAHDGQLHEFAVMLIAASTRTPAAGGQPRLQAIRTQGDRVEVENVGNADAMSVRIEAGDPSTATALVGAAIPPGRVSPGSKWVGGHLAPTFGNAGPFVIVLRWEDETGQAYSAQFAM